MLLYDSKSMYSRTYLGTVGLMVEALQECYRRMMQQRPFAIFLGILNQRFHFHTLMNIFGKLIDIT